LSYYLFSVGYDCLQPTKTGRYLDGRSTGGGGRCRRNIAGDLLCPHRPSRPSRGIVNNAIEATSRNHPCNRECAAGVGFWTVFHGLGSCSGQRVELRSRFASSAYSEHGLLSALLDFAVSATCLQIGYASSCLSCVIRDRWRRLKIPHEPSRESSHTAAARRQQLF